MADPMADDRTRGVDPLVRGASPLTGAFSTGGGEGRPRRRSGRLAAVTSLVMGVLWLGGFGSLYAVPFSILALRSGEIGRGFRWAAWVGLLLGIAGLAFAVVLAFHYDVAAR